MRKPTVCICEHKDTDQLSGNCEADQCLCFRFKDSRIPLLSKSEIAASIYLLCLYGLVSVKLWKPHCWFSHDEAHIFDNLKHSRLHCYHSQIRQKLPSL